MKYWIICLSVGVLILLLILGVTPYKKLKCVDDMCMVLEKTFLHPDARVTNHFFKSDVNTVAVETKDNVDYLVIKTKSSGDIYLKFLHTSKTAFQSKTELSKAMNKLFMDIVRSKKDYESKWLKDVGSIQIYVYGKPLFD